ncbi:MAG: alcohol dehydrogenase catalytic domain-containing protein [Acetobacteraceae bacterium]|nr:alcohol dehydrogenase catalytic domain-containing protein [Acetobacteraceae bacterium]
MKAMVLERFGEPLVMRDKETPPLGHGEVLVRVRACGVCGTDLKIWAGQWPTVRPPVIMGHEPAGVVAEVGPGTGDLKPGDRVVASLYITCGQCENCLAGRTTICLSSIRRLGFEVDGGFAEVVRAPASTLVKLPQGMPFTHAAILPDAVATPVHAFQRVRLSPGQTVLIIGMGGLGIHALQVARAQGLSVLACDVDRRRLELAQGLGADAALDPADDDVLQACRDFTGGLGVHAAMDAVGLAETAELGLRCLRMGGRLLQVGYSIGQSVALSSYEVAMRELEIVGVRAASRADLMQAVALVRAGLVRPVVGRTLPLEQANQALSLLRQGAVPGRVVLAVDGETGD